MVVLQVVPVFVKPPHTAQTQTNSWLPLSNHSVASCRPVRQKSALNTPLRRAANATVACTISACARCNKRVALVCKQDAGREVHARSSLYFRSKRNLTISDKNSFILNMKRGITKQTQINSSWTDITASLCQSCKAWQREWRNGVHRKPTRTQYSAPPTHRADSLAHRQSENPLAQTSDGPPPQTFHVESEQTMSQQLRKLPAQPNTPNKFVPDLVRDSPNASDVQRVGRCVPAFNLRQKTWAVFS